MVKEFQEYNYWALVIGGSSGLGLASAKKLASEGMNIIIIHRDRKVKMKTIQQDFSEIKSFGVELLSFNIDAMNTEKQSATIEAIKEKLGSDRIRTLVHSIAKGNLKPMTGDENSLKNDDFHVTIDAMGISLYDWTKAIFQANLFARDSRIISFTSAGNTKPWKGYAAVSAAKNVLEAITRNIALEFAPHGIRANCIQAGTVDTASFRAIPKSETLKEKALEANPFGRLTTAEDVANVVFLLSKNEAAWITGTVIPVDGGEHFR